MKKLVFLVSSAVIFFLTPLATHASSGYVEQNFTTIFVWIVIILITAKLSSLIERINMPAVLGELFVGIILGNLFLFGFPYLESIKHSEIISFLAQLGVVILLFQIGLESNISRLLRVGIKAIAIAVTGVVVTFFLIWLALPYIFPNHSMLTYIFFSATFVSTSVGISARVFKDLGKTLGAGAQLVLGAAVTDDVIGLIILAVITALSVTGEISAFAIALIAIKAISFLVFSIILGQLIAPYLGKFFSKIHTGVGMKFTLAISFALLFAFAAEKLGLAPIIGAFAAGLVLDSVHFQHFRKPRVVQDLEGIMVQCSMNLKKQVFEAIDHHTEHDIEDLIEPLGFFLVPIFFVLTGMAVDLSTFTNPKIFLIALLISALAIIGKLSSGFFASKGGRSIVGWGMVPRGEVQLIFAAVGLGLGLLTSEMYTIVVMVVLFTSLLTPIILSHLIKKQTEQCSVE